MTARSRAVRGSRDVGTFWRPFAALDPQPGRWPGEAPAGGGWGRGAHPRHSNTLATEIRLSSRLESDRRPPNAQAVNSRDSWGWDLDKKWILLFVSVVFLIKEYTSLL